MGHRLLIGALVAALSGCSQIAPSPLADFELYRNPENFSSLYGEGELAAQPVATWLANPAESEFVRVDELVSAAEAEGTLPVMVVYGIPNRDCGFYSAGGAQDTEQYLAWVGAIAAAIGERDAVIVLEPDAVPLIVEECLGPDTAETLSQAVDTLAAEAPQARVYIDAGNATWIDDLDALRSQLLESGLERADGFSVNVSNYVSTEQSITYAVELGKDLPTKNFIIDTSRNGAMVSTEDQESWCNNPDARLGEPPTTKTNIAHLDALLWVKTPGVSDGECNRGEPRAGEWWPEYAKLLASD